jgi:hypothetical protein
MLADPLIQKRKKALIKEARLTIKAIRNLGKNKVKDALIDPEILTQAVSKGILDAPHLKNNLFAKGTIRTRIIDAACEAVDDNGKKITESERLSDFL